MVHNLSAYVPLIPARYAIILSGVISIGLYGGALILQYFGELTPCSMCLWQRWPHMAIILLTLTGLCWHAPRLTLTLIFIAALASMVLGAYHAGVEWKFWPGPMGCTANLSSTRDLASLTDSLLATPVVQCDKITLSFLGLSLAGWNSLFSLDICLITLISLIKGEERAL